MMPMVRSRTVIVFVAGAVELTACSPKVRRPLLRSDAAQIAIRDFKTAAIVEGKPAGNPDRWDTAVAFGNPVSRATISGRANMSTVHVIYPDGPQKHPLFDYRDYTSIIDIRIKDATLFVYRVQTLVWTEYRLAVFDLAKRKQIADFLVSPDDMPPIKSRGGQ